MAASHVAVLVLVAALIAALFSTGLPGTVGDWGAYASCQLFQTDEDACERPGGGSGEDARATLAVPSAPRPEPLVCTVSASSLDHRRSSTWFSQVDVRGNRFVTSERSDGSVVVIDTEVDGSGSDFSFGFEFSSSPNSRVGLGASRTAVTLGESGRMYVLDEQDYLAYQATVEDISRGRYVHGQNHKVETASRWGDWDEFGDAADGFEYVNRSRQNQLWDHATHRYYRHVHDEEWGLTGSYKIASLTIAAANMTGFVVAEDRHTGERTLTFEFEDATSLGIGAGVFGLQAAAGTREGTGGSVSVDLSADGEVLAVSVVAHTEDVDDHFVGFAPSVPSVEAPGSGGITVSPGTNHGRFGTQGASGDRVEVTATLDVRDDPDERLVEQLLADPGARVEGFAEAVADRGHFLMQAYDVREVDSTSGGTFGVLYAIGGEDTATRSDLALTDVRSWDPVNGWRGMQDCAR